MTDGYLKTKVDWIPGLQNFRLKDLRDFIKTTDPNDLMVKFIIEAAYRVHGAKAIVFYTSNELESDVLNAVLLFSILFTPLALYLHILIKVSITTWLIQVPILGNKIRNVEWLESKKRGSVVYVNFGSIMVMTLEQLLEFALGLANSKQPFLWIISLDLVIGGSVNLSSKFVKIASWCPQEQVLNHSSGGGFLTHCGWNSKMESICAGVPMLC